MIDCTTRQFQLSLFDGSYVIKQDQDLIDLIASRGYTLALGVGSVSYFSQYINIVDNGAVDFCIWIQTEPFDFDHLIDRLNLIISHNMHNNGLIYLALNKYLVSPRVYDSALPEDYDLAIEKFVADRVHANIESYHACGVDQGLKFNWVHPLTQFILRVNK